MAWDGLERRKGNRMYNDFQPQGAFEGYVKATLENINNRLNMLPCPETLKRLNKVENDVSNIKGKATVIGAVTGFISALIAKYIMGK